MEGLKPNPLEWGVAGMPMPGFAESGDRHFCQVSQEGALLAAIDGIGHGEQAAAAAREACSVLEANVTENVIALIGRCHEKLKGTRGAAISLASFTFKESLMTWLAVGNVHGILLPAGSPWSGKEESLLQRPGVVGSQLPRLQAAILPLFSGDTVVFSTDGIEGDFDRSSIRSQPPQKAAEMILARHAKRNDDALIMIARYAGLPR
jgi:negative regulator of sigma-B (phosphoserine phosphatase)